MESLGLTSYELVIGITVSRYEFALKYLGKPQLELFKNIYPDAITRLQNNCQ